MLITKNLNSEANIAYSFDVNQYDDTTLNGKTNHVMGIYNNIKLKCFYLNWFKNIRDGHRDPNTKPRQIK